MRLFPILHSATIAAGSTAERGAGKDYTGSATATVTIPAGQVSVLTTVYIDPLQDSIDEGDGETVRIGGSHSGSLPVTAADIATTVTVTASLAEWPPSHRVWQPARGLATHSTNTTSEPELHPGRNGDAEHRLHPYGPVPDQRHHTGGTDQRHRDIQHNDPD